MKGGKSTTRRTFMIAVGGGSLVATAGCGSVLDGEPATVRWSLEMVGDDQPITDEDEYELDDGSYFTDRFEVLEAGEIRYTVEVIEGSAVNVFVLDEANEQAFEANEDFEAIEGAIHLDVDFTQQPGLELDPGVYTLIIYNGDDEPENA